MPGVALTELDDKGLYRGALTTKFGPTTVTFSGRVRFDVDHNEHVCRIEASGQDKRGDTGAIANATMAARAVGRTTVVELIGTIDVAGPLGQFAQAGGAHLMRSLLEKFATCVQKRLDNYT
jgi:carbon monoxide dehydrogenase subunit G